jgi:hypothetical protein
MCLSSIISRCAAIVALLSLSGCMGGYDRTTMAEVCRTVDRLDLHEDDHLTRRTQEQIALLNENLRRMCLD